MDFGEKISRLTDTQALWAVETVGRAIAADSGRAPSVLTQKVRALDGFDDRRVPVIVEGRVAGGPDEIKRAGSIARYALAQGAQDARPAVQAAVSSAVEQALEPETSKELVTVLLIGGALLLGLAVLAKLEVTADGKVVLHPGLPDIDKAGEAIGKLIKGALGAG